MDAITHACYPLAPINRRIVYCLLLTAMLALAGCGFAPLYQRTERGSPLEDLAAVQVGMIPNRSGQILRTHLRDDFNPNGIDVPGRYRLVVQIYEPAQELALQRNDTVARFGYGVTASFNLLDLDGRSLMAGSSSVATNFAVTNSQYATLVSRNDARDRLMQEVSGDIRHQVASFFTERLRQPVAQSR